MDYPQQDRQPDSHHQAGDFSVGPLQWARCPDDGLLHLLPPAEVVVAATGGHAEALCGQALSAAGLTLVNGLSGMLCMDCLNGVPSRSNDPGTVGSPAPGPSSINTDAAGRALRECFLANADRGDDAANDELVAELARQIRARRACREGGC
ncbi:MAG TPA: hypothetical protein VJT72_01295 [Pseudonocardiaceae bacterium]|nr:hypothetical protein [Pseudonocardiaceae bacterium]